MSIKIKVKQEPNKDPNHGHGAPTNRREFIARTFGTGVLTMMAPTILTQFAKGALAQELASCPTPSAPSTLPLYVIDLRGGYSAAANFIPKAQDGSFLASYRAHGVAPENHPSILGADASLGFDMHKSSGFLAGIMATTTDAIRQKVDGGLMPAISGDDSSNNQFSISHTAAAAGAVGTLIPTMGSEGSASGGGSTLNYAYYRSQFRPVRITSRTDALNLASYGNLATTLGAKGAERVSRAIASMSSGALNRFSDQVISKQLKDLMSCAYIDQAKLPIDNSAAKIDPLLNPAITAAFPNISGDGTQGRFATAVSLVSGGLAGQAVLAMGGYDYHGDTVASQVAKDRAVGDMVGRIFSAHANIGKSCVVLIYSDGSTSSGGGATAEATAGLPSTGNFQQTSDNGNQAIPVMLVYDHSATRAQKAKTRKRQVGWFRQNSLANTNTGVDSRSSPISSDVPKASMAFLANYLALMGREGELANILGGSSPFTSSQLEQVLLFSKIT